MTFEDFVKKAGGMEKAARIIGCSMQTVFRILHGKTRPSDLLIRRLIDLGVDEKSLKSRQK